MYTIDSFKAEDLESLYSLETKVCVSIFVPTSRSGRETLQGGIHLKNLLKDVERDLLELGLRQVDIAEMVGPAEALVADREFWQHQGNGLALFIAQGVFRMFGLPFSVGPRQWVGEAFDITPLLPMLSNDGRFYVLALSENAVRLFDATRYRIEEVSVEGMPTRMEDALGVDDPEKQQQRHGGAAGSSTYFGSGGGGGQEEHKADLKRFFDRVDAFLSPHLKDRPAPLVLAGVEYLLPIYRSANTAAKILDGEVHGNKDRASADELHEAAWTAAAPYFAEAQSKAVDRFNMLLATGGASSESHLIGSAATEGRVATLFVALADQGSPSINRAAVATLSKGGEIFALAPEAMPTDESLAAIFRH